MKQKLNWRAKLNPVFFELADVNRGLERGLRRIQQECHKKMKDLGDRPDPKLRDAIIAHFRESAEKLESAIDEKLVDINRRYPELSYDPLAYNYFDLESGDFADNLVPYLHWMRHRESFQATAVSDSQGDLKAWRKIARTGEDYRRIIHKKGPIKPYQGDVVHRQLLELMLCYELKPLTAEERADCADAYCACGKSHDPDALKKKFARLKRELQASIRSAAGADADSPKTKSKPRSSGVPKD